MYCYVDLESMLSEAGQQKNKHRMNIPMWNIGNTVQEQQVAKTLEPKLENWSRENNLPRVEFERWEKGERGAGDNARGKWLWYWNTIFTKPINI